MKLEISSDKILLKLSRAEKFLAVRRTDFEIPVSGIRSIELIPRLNWRKRQIRSPGTYIPGIIKAGSYWSTLGWEFWYAVRNQPCLVISGEFGKFQKVVLGLPQAPTWYMQLVSELKASHFKKAQERGERAPPEDRGFVNEKKINIP